MNNLTRRAFFQTGATCAALGVAGLPAPASSRVDAKRTDTVSFIYDGLYQTPAEYSELLAKLARDGRAAPDIYMEGGCVAELEQRFAKLLGKEKAVFVPTGTLANHLAIRCQAGEKSRVLVQAESHIYNDSLDCVSVLSNLNMVPLSPGRATVPVADVEEAYRRTASAVYKLHVGVISLECPVRRMLGAAFDFEEMKRIATFARKHDIKTHLDGARLFLASAYTGVALADYAALFDTVYISLYKYFNAGAGAVLAGPRGVIEKVAQTRKVFGGGIFQAWPYAAVALHCLDGFTERYRKAVATSRELFLLLEKNPRFRVETIPNGTNIVKLHVKDVDGPKYQAALKSRGVLINGPRRDTGEIRLTVNESAARRPAEELAKCFVEALTA